MSHPLSNFIFYLLSLISYLLSPLLLVLGRGTVLVLGRVAVKQGEYEAEDGEDYRGNDRNPYCN